MSFEWGGIDRMRSGPLFRIAGKASLRMRRHAYDWLSRQIGGFVGKVAIDHGATPDTTSIDSNCHVPWLLADGATVYATSAEHIAHLEHLFPGLHVLGWPPVPPQRANVVISSSVIAHVGDRERQLAYIEGLFELGDAVFLTTPNRRHWLEFHTKLPLLHWLPRARYQAALDRLGLGFWRHLNLLTRDELQSLFDQAASRKGMRLETRWYEPRLFGRVSNLVVLATLLR